MVLCCHGNWEFVIEAMGVHIYVAVDANVCMTLFG